MCRNLKMIVFAGLIASQVNIISAQADWFSSNAGWTWIKGANVTNQPGTYGTQGVPASANMPGARNSGVPWKDSSGALWLFGGYGCDCNGWTGDLNDLWKYNPITGNWAWMKGSINRNQRATYGTQGVPAPANTPGARSYAVSWTGADGALWLFGGSGYPASGNSGYLNDLWKYDPATGNWVWMKGANTTNQHGAYGAQGVANPANTPGARIDPVSWMDGVGTLWLFGGKGYLASGSSTYLNDLWKYDPATGTWTWMKGANLTSQHGIYGTQGIPDPANTPGGRRSAVSWKDDAGALWLFGGDGYDSTGIWGSLNDLWKYDPATGNWAWMKGSSIREQNGIYGTMGIPDPVNSPGARAIGVPWKDGAGSFWLFGGSGRPVSGSSGLLNDLWEYDPATGNWDWMKGSSIIDQPGIYGTQGVSNPANNPGARGCGATWTDDAGALWLFGGDGLDINGKSFYLNDLWKYDALPGGIALDTHALTFSATALGANPAAQVVGIANVGGKGFTYTNVITYSAGASGWLTVLPAAGAVVYNGATVLTNQINITGLGAGTYYATSQVTAVYTTNSPQSVVVTLTVTNTVGPRITANGLTGAVYLNSGDPATIAVQMTNMDPYLGTEVDWWVVAFAHAGAWYYLDGAMQWRSFSGDLAFCRPVYQGTLFNLSSTPVLAGFKLPAGTYNFWFAIDYPMDGILNLNGTILFDCVTVVVQ